MNDFARRCSSSRSLCAFLLAVLVVRALIPSGFMPAAGDGMPITLQLCTSHGLKSVTIPANGEDPPQSPGARDDTMCPFAAAATAAPAPVVAQFSALPRSQRLAIPTDAAGVHPASVLRAQSARAPPLSCSA